MVLVSEIDTISGIKNTDNTLLLNEKLKNTLNTYDFNMNTVLVKDEIVECIGGFIILPSHFKVLIRLVTAIGAGLPVMLVGGDACGKKELIKVISKGLRYNDTEVVRIKMGPHVDYTDLLGSYSTDRNCRFRWNYGILSRAISSGYFLAIDSWDQVSSEFLQSFLYLIDNNQITLPDSTTIIANDKFRIALNFNTDRSPDCKGLNILYHKFVVINMESLSREDIERIVSYRFPILKCISKCIMDVFYLIKEHSQTSFSELVRLCLYLSRSHNLLKSETMFDPHEFIICCLDIICASSPLQTRQIIKTSLFHYFQIDPVSAEATINSRYETMYSTMNLNSCSEYIISNTSLRQIHLMNICVKNNDPILLIGETGVGKTTLVQKLAKLNRSELVVLNMGRNTELCSLLGGVRPLSIIGRIKSLINYFSRNFRLINNIDNSRFIDKLVEMFKQSKYSAILRTLDRSLEMLPPSEITVEIKYRLSEIQDSFSKNETFNFTYVYGGLLMAIKEGHWILLDEINLAPDEILSTVSSLLEHQLFCFDSEIKIHPNFRLFACMNPPNDAGKKILPASLYNTFTKIFVDDITEISELQEIISSLLKNLNLYELADSITKFYIDIKLCQNHKDYFPKYNLRSLFRSFKIAYGLNHYDKYRCLYEGLMVSFLSELTGDNHRIWLDRLNSTFLTKHHSFSEPITFSGPRYISIEGFDVIKGDEQVFCDKKYIQTNLIREKLKVVSRVISLCNFPILFEGETAIGKTRLVTYLANITGNKCVRINNHEHTDIQDYIGNYSSDSTGQLIFNEGVLVKALRAGHWIVLDELNLAPSDVLEMLNRVLDDNRQLFIDETQEVINAHSNFRIFATQNPSSYSGRKELSRAFRSRFIQISLSDLALPTNILEIIQNTFTVSNISTKYMLNIFEKFQTLRKSTDLMAGRYGYITIRDLFRWCHRSNNSYDLKQFATIGYQLVSSRCRSQEEIDLVHCIFNQYLPQKVRLFPHIDYSSLNSIVKFQEQSINFKHIVWTQPLLYSTSNLLNAITHNEPTLLVGETGSGKTMICQLIAEALGKKLYSLSCHNNMESSDLIGNLVINYEDACKKFGWRDGILTEALKCGGIFVLDEISLSDDSVLERINSVLDSERTLVLYEKMDSHTDGSVRVKAHPDFRFISSMNPSGDYGKRELSVALRNRFTEIWFQNSNSFIHLSSILSHNLLEEYRTFVHNGRKIILSDVIIEALQNLLGFDHIISSRKLLCLAYFINQHTNSYTSAIPIVSSVYDSIFALFIDLHSSEPRQMMDDTIKEFLHRVIGFDVNENLFYRSFKFDEYENQHLDFNDRYNLNAPDIQDNLRRLHRALLFNKAIMLEGEPGTGKTTIVSHLALLSGKRLVRINFSEHTDLSDLFGTFVPKLENDNVKFTFQNGPFLSAILNGDWILLDEINLACQNVIEGLNSCFDHRSEIFLPDINLVVKINPQQTKIFATQNPSHSGHGRKVLPRSFLDRFIVVHMPPISCLSYKRIFIQLFPNTDESYINKFIDFLECTSLSIPEFSFNIRDIYRVLKIVESWGIKKITLLFFAFHLVFLSKIRSEYLSIKIRENFFVFFSCSYVDPYQFFGFLQVCDDFIKIGPQTFERKCRLTQLSNIHLIPQLTHYLGYMETGASLKFPIILSGKCNVAKTSLVKLLSMLHGVKLIVINITSETDLSDILGDFCFVDYRNKLTTKLMKFIDTSTDHNLIKQISTIFENFVQGNHSALYDLLPLIPSDHKLRGFIESYFAMLEKELLIEYKHSRFVTALQKGYWVLFDNINFGNPAIIDRLNSILELDGSLYLQTEDSFIKPHPNFRFFATYNPDFGEISLSLRNRCLEIHMSDTENSELFYFLKLFKLFPSNHDSLALTRYNAYLCAQSLSKKEITSEVLKNEYSIIKYIKTADTSNELTKLLFIEECTNQNLELRLKFLHMNPFEIDVDVFQKVLNMIQHIPKINQVKIFQDFPASFLHNFNSQEVVLLGRLKFLLRLNQMGLNNFEIKKMEGDSLQLSKSIQNLSRLLIDKLFADNSDNNSLLFYIFQCCIYCCNFFKIYKNKNMNDILYIYIFEANQYLKQLNINFKLFSPNYSEQDKNEFICSLYFESPYIYDIRSLELNRTVNNLYIENTSDLMATIHNICNYQESTIPLNLQVTSFHLSSIQYLELFVICNLLVSSQNDNKLFTYVMDSQSIPPLVKCLLSIISKNKEHLFLIPEFISILFSLYLGDSKILSTRVHSQPYIYTKFVQKKFESVEPMECVWRFIFDKLPFKLSCAKLLQTKEDIENTAREYWMNMSLNFKWNSILKIQHKMMLKNILLLLTNKYNINNINLKQDLQELSRNVLGNDSLVQQLGLFHVDTAPKDTKCIYEDYIFAGRFLINFFSKLPFVDPCKTVYVKNKLTQETIKSLHDELHVRNNLHAFRFSSQSSYCDHTFKVITSLINELEISKCRKKALDRPTEQYNEFRVELLKICENVNMVFDSQTSQVINHLNYQFLLRQHEIICKNFENFSDLILPIKLSIQLIIFGINALLPENDENIQTATSTKFDLICTTILHQLIEFHGIFNKITRSPIPQPDYFLSLFKVIIEIINLTQKIILEIDQISSSKTLLNLFDELPELQIFDAKPTNRDKIDEFVKYINFHIFSQLNALFVSESNITDKHHLFRGTNNSNTFLILNNIFKKYISSENIKHINIYEFGNIEIVECFVEYVTNLHSRIEYLSPLTENQILNELKEYIEKIKLYDISSPSIIFLNCMDYIYRQLLNYNLTVPNIYKIEDYVDQIKALIIKFRSHQLHSWKFILDNTRQKSYSTLSLALAELFIILTSNDDNVQLIVYKFLSKQSVGNFCYCFQTVKSFIKFAIYVKPDFISSKISTVLNYFEQFVPVVETFIQTKSQSIVDELNNFVKISTWKDFNYWSIKESSERAYRNLHKYIQNYQKILQFPFTLLLNKHVFHIKLLVPASFFSCIPNIIDLPTCSASFELSNDIVLSYNTINKVHSIFTQTHIFLTNLTSTTFYPLCEIIAQKYFTCSETFKINKLLHDQLNDLFPLFDNYSLSANYGRTLPINSLFQNISDHFPFILNSQFMECSNSYSEALYSNTILDHCLDKKSDHINNQHINLFKGYMNHIFYLLKNGRSCLNSLNSFLQSIHEFYQMIEEIHLASDFYHYTESNPCIFSSLHTIDELINELILLLNNRPTFTNNLTSPFISASSESLNATIKNSFQCLTQMSSTLHSIIHQCERNLKYSFISSEFIEKISSELNYLKKTSKLLCLEFSIFTILNHNVFESLLNSIIQYCDVSLSFFQSCTKITQNYIHTCPVILQDLTKKMLKPFEYFMELNQTQPINYTTLPTLVDTLRKSYQPVLCLDRYQLAYQIVLFKNVDYYSMIKYIIHLNLCILEQFKNLLLMHNVSVCKLYSLVSCLACHIIANQNIMQQELNQKTTEIGDNEVEPAGFGEGKGHDDVTKDIETQDQVEDTVQQDHQFDSDQTDICSNGENENIDDGQSDGIEMDEGFNDANDEIFGKQEDEDQQQVDDDIVSDLSQEPFNDLNPEIWADENDSKLEQASQTDLKKIDDGEKMSVDSDSCASYDENSIEDLRTKNDAECNEDDQNVSGHYDDEIIKSDNELTPKESDLEEDKCEDVISHAFQGLNDSKQHGTTGLSDKQDKTDKVDELSHQNIQLSDEQSVLSSDERSATPMLDNQDLKRTCEFTDDVNERPPKATKIYETDDNLKETENNNAYSVSYEYHGMSYGRGNQQNEENIELEKQTTLLHDKSDKIEKNDSNKNTSSYNINPKIENIDEIVQETIKSLNFNENTRDTFKLDLTDCQKELCDLPRSLCEELRMIIEPTLRNKYNGNYKSGKKINIKRIISYIASKYTKDKIWLRRMKPSNRNYKIIIGIDDSSSMIDNNTRKIAFLSTLLLSTTFKLLQIGQTCITSFGEKTQILIDFDQFCTDQLYQNIINQLHFTQSSTKYSNFLDFCHRKFTSNSFSSRQSDFDNLLIIISDGRGIFNEGQQLVKNSISTLLQSNIFVIFIVLDTTIDPKESITKIQVPIFSKSSPLEIKPYLDLFPFQYFIILNDIKNLPHMVSSVTKQWIQSLNN